MVLKTTFGASVVSARSFVPVLAARAAPQSVGFAGVFQAFQRLLIHYPVPLPAVYGFAMIGRVLIQSLEMAGFLHLLTSRLL